MRWPSYKKTGSKKNRIFGRLKQCRDKFTEDVLIKARDREK